MNKELLESVIEAQIFNDSFEVPGLEFLAELETSRLKAMVSAAVVPFVLLSKKDEPDINSILTAMGNAAAKALKVQCNSQNTVRLGSFILSSMHLCGLLDIEEMEDGIRTKYILVIEDPRAVANLWKGCVIHVPALRPLLQPAKLDIGRILRRNNPKLFPDFTPEKCPLVFDLIEKSNNKGWWINEEILSIARQLLEGNSEVFDSIWKTERHTAKASKLRLVSAILDTADDFKGQVFYHEYFLDFRGRIYPYTAFLNEQSIDISKGLLRLAGSRPLGEHGLKWIKVGIATCWAGKFNDTLKTDKIPVADRVAWVDENLDELLAYADCPLEVTGWMQADAPWQMLAHCMELSAALEMEEELGSCEDFMSGLVVYVDGSNNGSQHLAALTRDEVSAPHVNLTPSSTPGDLYKFISNFVWQEIAEQVKNQEEDYESIIAKAKELRASLKIAQHVSAERKAAQELAKAFRLEHKEKINAAAATFWNSITDLSHRRKVSKRGVMTITYGATPYGMGEQVIDDAPKHGIELLMDMERSWGAYMGQLIHKTAFKYMPRSTGLLTIFETAGRRKGVVGKSLAWKVPKTNFPAIQDYTRGPPVTVTCKFSDTTLKISTYSKEVKVEQPSKQKSGAAPNIVHSLDAAHLTLVVANADYPIVTVHDSFGASPGDMEHLFHHIRAQFVSLYKDNPLPDLLEQIGVPDLEVEYGTLDITEVLKSEFCFL
jgi:hypothetical protein